MIKALIIDDESAAADVLQLMIRKYIPEITLLEVTTNTEEAISLIRDFQPQLVFLDIVMPAMNGFELLERISKANFDVIFTTAFDEYAIQAIRFSALDYLLKPIDVDELKSAVQRFIEKRKLQSTNTQLYRNLIDNLKAREEKDFRLAIPTNDGARFVSIDELIRCEGERNYTWFYLTEGRKHLSARTIKDYQDMLDEHGFIRIHKSHLVNRKFIEYYLGEGAVLLNDKTKLPVSRQRKDQVVNLLSDRSK